MKRTLILLMMLSPALFAQQAQRPDPTQMFMQQFDANKDGTVTEVEFLTPMKQQFKMLDADGNGSVTAAEINAFTTQMQQRMQQMQQQQGGQPPR